LTQPILNAFGSRAPALRHSIIGRRTNGARWTSAGIILLLAAISIGCARSDENSRQALAAEVAKAQQQSRMADFAKAVPVEWETLFMFAPYTDRKRIEEQLGFRWPEADKAAIQDSDMFWLFVFVKDHRVVTWVDFVRADGDPINLGDAGRSWSMRFARNEAKFKVRADDQRRRLLER
jgi:hypothetical protein